MSLFAHASNLKLLLAESSTFQTALGVANSTAAKPHISVGNADEEFNPAPRAVIEFTGSTDLNNGTANWVTDTTLRLSFELQYSLPAESADGMSNSYEAFEAQISAIIDEMKALSATGDSGAGETYIDIKSFTVLDGPAIYTVQETPLVDPNTDTQKCIWWVQFEVATY